MTGATRQASASAGRARWGPSAMIAFPRTTGAKDATVSRPFPDGGAFRLEEYPEWWEGVYMGLLRGLHGSAAD